MKKISIIVPCFNEEDVLPLFYKEVTHVLESIENIDYEILFINDGSHDHSEDILKLLAHKNPLCRQGCLCEIYFIFKKFWKRSRYVCRT